jgi:import receptor subunit TOM70
MSPPQHDLVVRDCDIALQLDKTYIKALNRRAAAHEGLNQLQEALRDYTAATILDKFQNESTAQAVERVLKKLAQQTAEDMLKAREPRLPSYTFVSAYFAAFRARPKPTLPSEEEGQLQGDNTLMMGLDALAAADYVHAFTLINESLDQGVSTDKLRAVALNQRGTFKFLVGDVAGAKADLEASLALDRSLTQTWVKIASVHMERGDPQAAFAAFNEAIMQDENDADIYYHRGQVLFIMNEFAEAAENYTKSTELDGNFVFSQIQLAVAQYKGEMLGKAMATFRATLRNFPNRSEPQNYYGELLLDQGRFEEAVEKFEKAVELEKAKYVYASYSPSFSHHTDLISSLQPPPERAPNGQQGPRALPMEAGHRRRRELVPGGARDRRRVRGRGRHPSTARAPAGPRRGGGGPLRAPGGAGEERARAGECVDVQVCECLEHLDW